MSLILGIESSCDETAAAIVKDGYEVISSVIASQIAKHAMHGGVVPELAAREHLVALNPVLETALREADVTLRDIDAIAVTQGPGLIPALIVGLNFAKGLSQSNRIPLIGVNHFIGHIYSAFLGESAKNVLENPASYPLLALVVSGGHTSLILIDQEGNMTSLGSTIDDAAGEALDKGAKLLGLGYPGGPVIQKTAETGDAKRFDFPRPLTGTAGKALSPENLYNFSFSGIKTALLYHARDHAAELAGNPQFLADTVASYQEAVVDVLCKKTMMAAKNFNVKTIVCAGGVACNSLLRTRLEALTPASVKLQLAERRNCTDNAAMIGALGYHYHKRKEYSPLDIDAYARLPRITKVPFLGD